LKFHTRQKGSKTNGTSKSLQCFAILEDVLSSVLMWYVILNRDSLYTKQ